MAASNSTSRANGAKVSGKITLDQIGIALQDIATMASTIDRISIMLIHEEDGRNLEALFLSVGGLAQRVGWVADMVLNRMSTSGMPCGGGPCYGDAEQWMMPPTFHDACAKVQP